ncbi:hypothetical protein FRC06_004523 [Ceratobasidium sp. 370]|nr:hypothetical protein FRC06_004523 [Ceratobasidium sp. 370]
MARQKQAARKTTGGKAPRKPMPPSYDSEDESALAPISAPNQDSLGTGAPGLADCSPLTAGEHRRSMEVHDSRAVLSQATGGCLGGV